VCDREEVRERPPRRLFDADLLYYFNPNPRFFKAIQYHALDPLRSSRSTSPAVLLVRVVLEGVRLNFVFLCSRTLFFPTFPYFRTEGYLTKKPCLSGRSGQDLATSSFGFLPPVSYETASPPIIRSRLPTWLLERDFPRVPISFLLCSWTPCKFSRDGMSWFQLLLKSKRFKPRLVPFG